MASELRALDSAGTEFHLTGSIAGGGTSETLTADGHVRRGSIEMTVSSGTSTASCVVFDGVLYGERPGSNHWLEMNADPATFLWPGARLSLVWESVLLSPSSGPAFRLAPDQLILLAGALAGSTPDGFARGVRGEIRIRRAGARLLGWEVLVTGGGGLRIDSAVTVGKADADEIAPPPAATPGSVVGLLFTPAGTVA